MSRKPSKPETRIEDYLDVMTGGNAALPQLILRIEFYYAFLAGMTVKLPQPILDDEKLLAKICGMEVEAPTYIPGISPRLYAYMAKKGGQDVEIPQPVTREEMYWFDYVGGEPIPSEQEYTGAVPVTFVADGTPLIDYIISGNTTQSGTPTPDNPIMPQGTGERTRNLFDKTNETIGSYMLSDGTIARAQSYSLTDYIPINEGSSYTISAVTNQSSAAYHCFYTEDKVFISSINCEMIPRTFTTPANAKYIRCSYRVASNQDIMLNSGQTPLPYEPYGYKLDILSGGVNLWDINELHEAYSFITVDGATVLIPYNISVSQLHSTGVNVSINAPFTISFNGVQIDNPATNARVSLVFEDDTGLELHITDSSGTARASNSGTYNKNLKSIRFNWTVFNSGFSFKNFMLNSGSTALPYEPYVQPTLSNIYLGNVQTTRKIKKLVLTGEENWKKSTTYQGSFYAAILDNAMLTRVLCTHAEYVSPISAQTYVYGKCGTDGGASTKNINLFIGESSWTVDDFKAYIAQQCAAGTPVTVWYVLATEKTGIVNEPLMRIGDYADTLSYAQAGVPIPTANGSTTLDVETTVKPSEVYIKYRGEAVATLSAFPAEVSSTEAATEEVNPEEMEEEENEC